PAPCPDLPLRRARSPPAYARCQVPGARPRRDEPHGRRGGRPGGAPGPQTRALPPRSRHNPGPPRCKAAMSDPRRTLPAVDALLAEPDVAALLATHPRALVVRAVRDTLEAARADGGAVPRAGWPRAIAARAARLAAPSLAGVVNATGVVLHTNLGRAVLARAAADA